MKTHIINSGDHFIRGYYIDPKICKKLITNFEKRKKEHEPGQVGAGEVVKKGKDSLDLKIAYNESPLLTSYFDELQKCKDLYRQEFTCLDSICFPWDLKIFSRLQRYKKGQGFHSFHYERGHFRNDSACLRMLVWMTYLNTIKKKGETEFLNQKLKIKPEAGLTLLWPSEWTHTHRGNVCDETKYIITGWYEYIEYRN